MNMQETFQAELQLFLRLYTPPGTRAMVDSTTPMEYADISLCCSGQKSIFAYYCGREPGHTGPCCSFNKDMDFTPDKGTR